MSSSSARRLLALALLVLAAAGCGGGGGERAAVSGYVEDVNAIQAEMQKPLAEVAQANEAFATRDDLAAVAPRLAESERTLGMLQTRLLAIVPPAPAERLHQLLLQLVGAQTSLAEELHDLALFLPRFRGALAGLKGATTKLNRSLAAARTPAEESTALDAYAAGLASPLARLRALRPPALIRPNHESQVLTLARLSTSARDLAIAIRDGDLEEATPRIRQFETAARTATSLAAQRAQINAVKAYNARVRNVGSLAGKARVEAGRLQATVD